MKPTSNQHGNVGGGVLRLFVSPCGIGGAHVQKSPCQWASPASPRQTTCHSLSVWLNPSAAEVNSNKWGRSHSIFWSYNEPTVIKISLQLRKLVILLVKSASLTFTNRGKQKRDLHAGNLIFFVNIKCFNGEKLCKMTDHMLVSIRFFHLVCPFASHVSKLWCQIQVSPLFCCFFGGGGLIYILDRGELSRQSQNEALNSLSGQLPSLQWNLLIKDKLGFQVFNMDGSSLNMLRYPICWWLNCFHLSQHPK